MNGANALIQTLSDCGIDVCFDNPGTSEMQLVRADTVEGFRQALRDALSGKGPRLIEAVIPAGI